MRLLALVSCAAAFAPVPQTLVRRRRSTLKATPNEQLLASVPDDDAAEALELFERGCALLDEGAVSRAAAELRHSVEIDATHLPTLGALHVAADELLTLAAADDDDGPVARRHLEDAEACWRASLRAVPPEHRLASATSLAGTLRRARKFADAADATHDALDYVPDAGATTARAWLWGELGTLIEDLALAPRAGAPAEARSGEGVYPQPIDVVVGSAREALSPEECYLRAIEEEAGDNGDAWIGATYKRLAEWRALTRGAEAATGAFAAASRLLPDDICCATHALYGAPPDRPGARALQMAPPDRTGAPGLPTTAPHRVSADGTAGLDDDTAASVRRLTIVRANDEDDASWGARAAARFERDGVVVLPGLLDDAHGAMLDDSLAAAEAEGAKDFTDQTHAAARGAARTHRALPLAASAGGEDGDSDGDTESAAVAALDAVVLTLWPMLSRALQVVGDDDDDGHGGRRAPLIGAGFMRVAPGAAAQALHKDVSGHDRHAAGAGTAMRDSGPRAISIQIQLTDTTHARRTGALEVLPRSHRPDAAVGKPGVLEAIAASDGDAVRERHVVPIAVPRGTVTVYSSRLWHRGGANHGSTERTFAFLTVTEPDAPAPFGLIHTMTRADVGRWALSPDGLLRLALDGDSESSKPTGTKEEGARDLVMS